MHMGNRMDFLSDTKFIMNLNSVQEILCSCFKTVAGYLINSVTAHSILFALNKISSHNNQ